MTPRYTLWCRLTPLSLQHSHCLQSCYYDYGLFQNVKTTKKNKVKKRSQKRGWPAALVVAVPLLLVAVVATVSFFYLPTRTWVICIEKLIESPLFSLSPPSVTSLSPFSLVPPPELRWRVDRAVRRLLEECWGTIWNERGSRWRERKKFDRNKMQSQEGVR